MSEEGVKYLEFPVIIGDRLFQPHRYKSLRGGRGSTKSWSAGRALVARAAERPTRVLCTREVQKSIKDSVHKLLSDQIVDLELDDQYTILENSITHNVTGSEFLFSGLSTHTVHSIKSFEGCDVCWVEEAQVVRKRSWDILIPTIRKSESEIWLTWNPDLETDETYQRFVVNPPPDCLDIEINWKDNPWWNSVMEQERIHCKETDPDNYDNIWEGKCRPAVEGAIYYKEILAAETEGRICDVPYDPMLKVHVVFDLGHNDNMVISLVQKHLSTIRIIRVIKDNRRTLDDYSAELKDLRYNWGKVWLPHDGFSKDYKTGKSSQEILQAQGWDVPSRDEIVETSVEEGIKNVRMAFPRVYFDKTHSADLVESLKRYRRRINRTTETEAAPLHDDASDGADCFRYTCLNIDNMHNEEERKQRIHVAGYGPLDSVIGY